MIYVAVTSKENFKICLDKNLFADRKDTRLKKIELGDIIVFYIKGKGCFNAIAKVKSKVRYNPVKEFSISFPYTIGLDFVYNSEEKDWIKLKDISDKLEFIRNKQTPPGKFFQNSLCKFPEQDYNLIEKLIKEKI